MTRIKKKILMLTSVAMLAILTSSMIAISQAWGPKKCKSDFVGYELKGVFGDVTITYMDTSGAPNLVITEATHEIIELNVTIDGKVYSYPEDFDHIGTTRVERNAITGEGFVRAENTLIFNLAGKPTLTDLLVTRVSGFRTTPDGTFITPEDFRTEGEFELTGTKWFRKVDGFGLEEGYFLPPDYTKLYAHHFGLIKGWPL